ncbi:MAG TPA: type II secretion system inner membrane protein GspF [Burkholderiales bacterium]|nr:type II secretion system inner membrane protein GspF [Burkholderiales bacterium]
MEAFRYEALDADGRTITGVVQADTPRQARSQLRAQGLLPSVVDRVSAHEARASRGIAPAELALLTRQLSALLASGLTMEQSLNALAEEAARPLTREVLAGVKAEIAAGASLAGAMAAYARSFPDFYRALVQGGEESGALATVLAHLADYLDASLALKQKALLALLYPALISVVAVAIVGGLLVYVVPQVVQVFQQSRQALPLLTRGLIAVSGALRAAWPFLAAAAVAGFAAARWALQRAGPRLAWDGWLLRLPWLGAALRGLNTARFAATLAILVGGGVPLLSALASGGRAMGNRFMRAAVDAAAAQVREGAGLARALAATGAFPPLFTHLLASGELSGKLRQMLERAAQLESQALERRLAVMLALLEPVMILVMGGVVLLIVLAILLPIIQINQLVR